MTVLKNKIQENASESYGNKREWAIDISTISKFQFIKYLALDTGLGTLFRQRMQETEDL